MRLLIVATALVSLLFSATLSAQSLTFGEAFPLTNTRYGTTAGIGKLATDGRSELLFWSSGEQIRVTKLVDGERRGGRGVLDARNAGTGFDAVWTGQHYLLAAHLPSPQGLEVHGRLVDATGEPLGEEFRIVGGGAGPKLASNARVVLMLYYDTLTDTLRSVALTNAGATRPQSRELLAPRGDADIRYQVASNGSGFAAVVVTSTRRSLFAFDHDGHLLWEMTLPSRFSRQVSISSDGRGRDYFVAGAADGGIFATLIAADGTISHEFIVDPDLRAIDLDTLWTGSSWIIAARTHDSKLHFIYLDAMARRIIGRDTPISGTEASMIAARGRLTASWRSEEGATRIARLPLAADETGTIATHAAGEQEILATATGDTGTVVVWRETVDLATTYRAGVRTRDGDWIERSLTPAFASDPTPVSAASDGQGYAIVLKPANENETVVFRLDERLRTNGVTRLPFHATDIAWRGSDYVLAGPSGQRLLVATLTPSGVLSTPKVVGDTPTTARLATTGNYTLVTSIYPGVCPILCPLPEFGNVATVQLDSSLNPIGPQRDLGYFADETAQVTVDGNTFHLAWIGENEFGSARIIAGSTTDPEVDISTTGAQRITDPDVVSTTEGVIYTWLGQTDSGWRRYFELLPRFGGPRLTSLLLDRYYDRHSILTTLPTDEVALFAAVPNRNAPHHGSTRVMTYIGTFTGLLNVPDAPQLTGVRDGTRLRLSWTRPSQPVNGYRIEYRISDGSWHELDQWYSENELAEILNAESRPIAFRLRAFADGGTSDYSNTVFFGPGKRRSVR